MAKNHALAAALGEKHSRRTRGDNALSSSAALIFFKLVANSADNFAMKGRSGGRQFKSTLLHTSISRVSDIAENRSKSARVRAICAHVRTRRISLPPRIGRIWRNLSRRDLPRSADHRFKFARRSSGRPRSFCVVSLFQSRVLATIPNAERLSDIPPRIVAGMISKS